jgi:hypothetical protein
MQGEFKGHKGKKHVSFWEYALLLLIGVFAFMLAGDLHDKGIPQKWATAIMGTIITFGFVVYVCRRMLNRWAFWAATGICLGAHILVVWVFFQYVLNSVERFSILFWYPLMLVEAFGVLIVVKRIHDKLTGKHETVKLSM